MGKYFKDKRGLVALLVALIVGPVLLNPPAVHATDHAGQAQDWALTLTNALACDTITGASDSTTARIWLPSAYDGKVYLWYDANQACTLYVRAMYGPDSAYAKTSGTLYTVAIAGAAITAVECTLALDYRMYDYYRLCVVNKNAGNDSAFVRAYFVADIPY
jgi:hypothetical protein